MKEEGNLLQRAAEVVNLRARVWRGSGLPSHEQGICVLGAPGDPDFVRSHLQKTAGEHQTLLEMIPLLPDVQSAWMMLLHCASARANYHLRVIRPELALQLPPLTINICGVVCARFWESPLPLHMPPPRQVPHFLWPSVGWDCGVQ